MPSVPKDEMLEFINKAAGIDGFLQYVMRELENCDDQIYNNNLTAAHYIDVNSRKQTLMEIRDEYCKFISK